MRRTFPVVLGGFGVAAAMTVANWAYSNRDLAVAQERSAAVAATRVVKTPLDPQATANAKSLSKAFRAAAENATPSVVKIKSHTKAKLISRGAGPLTRENPFKGTPFEDMVPELGEGFNGRMPQRDGVGSGVIIDGSGTVLTNNHVVDGADTVTVSLADGREFTATDIKTDPESDLAVLKLQNAKDLPFAKIGNSDDLEIGDWVIAIGNPFELEATVSAGIISGKGRELGSIRRSKFLQTDAAINPGNSGGPLLNLDGEVIGINTAIASSSGGNQGIGFAIPINQATWVTKQLIAKGSVERGYLGVGIGPLTAELAKPLGLQPNGGVLVAEVMPDSPAAKAGVVDGDVVTAVNGKAVASPRELQELIEQLPIGSQQKLEVFRDGKTQTLSVTVKALPEKVAKKLTQGKNVSPRDEGAMHHDKSLGLEVSDMNATDKKMFDGYTGVVVASVDEDGPAAEKGLEAGMLIRKVGKLPVGNAREFAAAVEKEMTPDGVVLQLRTAAGNRFVVLKSKA